MAPSYSNDVLEHLSPSAILPLTAMNDEQLVVQSVMIIRVHTVPNNVDNK